MQKPQKIPPHCHVPLGIHEKAKCDLCERFFIFVSIWFKLFGWLQCDGHYLPIYDFVGEFSECKPREPAHINKQLTITGAKDTLYLKNLAKDVGFCFLHRTPRRHPPQQQVPWYGTVARLYIQKSNLNKFTWKGTLRQVFYLSEAPSPPMTPYSPPLHTVIVQYSIKYLFTQGSGVGGANQRGGQRGNSSQSWSKTPT